MSIGAKKENTVLITERMKKDVTASTENNCLAYYPILLGQRYEYESSAQIWVSNSAKKHRQVKSNLTTDFGILLGLRPHFNLTKAQ